MNNLKSKINDLREILSIVSFRMRKLVLSNILIIGLCIIFVAAFSSQEIRKEKEMSQIKEQIESMNSQFNRLEDINVEQTKVNDELLKINDEVSSTLKETNIKILERDKEVEELKNALQKTTEERDSLKKTWASRQSQRSNISSSNVSGSQVVSGWSTYGGSAYSYASEDAYAGAQWGDKTALGTNVRPGVIAVDRRVIPLGTKVELKFPAGFERYNGIYTAEDTGSAIKGNRIDIFMTDYNQCATFGRRDVQLRIIK